MHRLENMPKVKLYYKEYKDGTRNETYKNPPGDKEDKKKVVFNFLHETRLYNFFMYVMRLNSKCLAKSRKD